MSPFLFIQSFGQVKESSLLATSHRPFPQVWHTPQLPPAVLSMSEISQKLELGFETVLLQNSVTQLFVRTLQAASLLQKRDPYNEAAGLETKLTPNTEATNNKLGTKTQYKNPEFFLMNIPILK